MATPEERAVDLKNQGNKAFAAHDWPTAIDFYSKAIELNSKEPTFWSNRAQVRTILLQQPRSRGIWSRD
jgi:serine/threonine-protein phosphatase 5